MAGLMLILAHPDDESFAGGATLGLCARRGWPTALLCYTDGQAGRNGLSGQPPLVGREGLGALRREELRRACARLGLGELITPGWPDKGLAMIDEEEAVALTVRHVRRLRPDVIISFGPEGAPNKHADHIASARWAQLAYERAADPAYRPEAGPPHAAAKYYWITWPPEVDELRGNAGAATTAIIELGEELERAKRAAFAEHRTQHDHLDLYNRLLALLAGREFFHLAQSRLAPPPQGIETDLMAGIEEKAR